LEGLEST
jgi:vacuolar protein sorting-associated protein 13A/C